MAGSRLHARRQQSCIDAEQRFLDAISTQGATLAPGTVYSNNRTPVALICAHGHACSPRPREVLQGGGVCFTCSGQDPLIAEAKFLASIAGLGASLAPGSRYKNAHLPMQLICASGHACNPRPMNVRTGQGICNTCVGQDPVAAEEAFWIRIAEFGAKPVVGAEYRDKDTPVQLICELGHRCNPTPGNVRNGRGICRQCIVTFDRVYLLLHPSGAIKIGVASGQGRVKGHLGRGYILVAEWLGLTHERAAESEKLCILFWRSQGWTQIDASPKDGRTETTSSEHLTETLAWLNSLITTHPQNPTH